MYVCLFVELLVSAIYSMKVIIARTAPFPMYPLYAHLRAISGPPVAGRLCVGQLADPSSAASGWQIMRWR